MQVTIKNNILDSARVFFRSLYLLKYVIIGLLTPMLLFSQQPKSAYHFFIDGYHGRIMPHNERFGPSVTESSHALELGFSKLRSGYKSWHQQSGFPEVGWVAHFAAFGDREVFGKAIGIYPFVRFIHRGSERLQLSARIGAGIAYLDTPYHPVENPTNNVIGAHWNNITSFQTCVHYQLHERFSLRGGIAVTHYSNGKSRSPNLGINTGNFSLGAQYAFHGKVCTEPVIDTIEKRRFSYVIKAGMGMHDRGLGSSRHPVWTKSFHLAWRYHRQSYLWLGSSLAFDRAEYEEMLFTALDGERPSYAAASDWSIFAGHEQRVGNVGLWVLCGYYLFDPSFNPEPIYFKFGLHYYPLLYQSRGNGLVLFVNIKSHYGSADYFEWGMGYTF